MRITGGQYKGRKITCPPGIIRPAMDRMRESLFAILYDLNNKSFLDLYSGSGIVVIEAASRGAEPVYLIEKDVGKRITILKNLSFVESLIQLIMTPCERYIKKTKEKFDFIYCDPPFKKENKEEIIKLIQQHNIVNAHGSIIMHAPAEDIFLVAYDNITLYDKRKYGRSVLYFYRERG